MEAGATVGCCITWSSRTRSSTRPRCTETTSTSWCWATARTDRSGGSALQAVHPALEIRELVLRLAGKKVDESALDALALEQRVVDLAGDRHLDAELVRHGDRGI